MAHVGSVKPKPVKHNRPSFHELKELSESKKILPYFHTENGKKIHKSLQNGSKDGDLGKRNSKADDGDSSSDELADKFPPSPVYEKSAMGGDSSHTRKVSALDIDFSIIANLIL